MTTYFKYCGQIMPLSKRPDNWGKWTIQISEQELGAWLKRQQK